jgi:MFS family permease
VNGISFLAIIVGLLMMSIPWIEKARPKTGALEELREGVQYVRHHPVIMGIVLMMAVGGLLGLSFLTIIPAWSVEMLKGDATTNGLLQAGRGVGALIMALYLISLGNFKYKGKLIQIGSIAGALLTIVFAFTRSTALSFIMLVGVGMSFLLVNNLSTVLAQMHTEDRLRGRVMGVYTFVFFGFMPIGSLWVGAAASWIGEQWAIIICGVLTLITSVWIFRAFPQLSQAE